MTTLTHEKLASLRAAAARAADGWSPTSSSWAALEHCAEASPLVVTAMVAELMALREETRALEAERDGMAKALELARARLVEVTEQRDLWKRQCDLASEAYHDALLPAVKT